VVKFVEMDDNVKFSSQLEERDIGPVILINKFNMKPEDVNEFLNGWAAEAEFLKRQPGFVSTQLHRGIAGSCVFLNYAVWESTEQYNRAIKNPESQSMLAKFPAITMSPHLFKKLAVPGICVD
jgi:heme-degrading monooxygenase HmoA